MEIDVVVRIEVDVVVTGIVVVGVVDDWVEPGMVVLELPPVIGIVVVGVVDDWVEPGMVVLELPPVIGIVVVGVVGVVVQSAVMYW